MTSTANTSTTVICQKCKRPVTLGEGVKASVCPYCGEKIASSEKVATK